MCRYVNHKNVKKALRRRKPPFAVGLTLGLGLCLSTEVGERLWEKSVDSFVECR